MLFRGSAVFICACFVMSLLSEVTSLGEKLGYEGKELATFVKEQMDIERDERAAAREAEKERAEADKERADAEKERIKAEKERIEAEIRLQSLKTGSNENLVPVENLQFSNWQSKLIPKFNESEVVKFFVAFERVAQQLSWEEQLWPIICQSAFTGKAQIAYAALSDEDSKDYSQVKAAVLSAYELVPEAYRQKFRSWQKRNFQTYVEFAKQKEIKFDGWLYSEEVKEFDSLRELVLLEDFKNNLPRDIRAHIEEFGITSLEGAAKAADKYVLSHKGNLVRKGSNTGGTGSGQEDRGSNCLSPKKGGKGLQGIVCYGCGTVGHVKRKCPELARNAKPAMLVNCCRVPSTADLSGQEGKVTRDLKADFGHYVSAGFVGLNSSMKDRRKVMVLRDIGACQSCILESALPANFVLEGSEYVLLGGFPESVSSWPVQNMYIDCPYFSGWCKLAIVKSFPVNGVDIVIGNDLVLEREGTAQAHVMSELDGKVEVCSKPLIPLTRSQS